MDKRQRDMLDFIESHGDQISTALYNIVSFWADRPTYTDDLVPLYASQAKSWQKIRDDFDSIYYGE